MDGGELLKIAHPSKPQHRPLPPPKRQMRVLGAIVGPTDHLTIIAATNILKGGPVRSQPVRDQNIEPATATKRFTAEFQCCAPVPRLGHEALEDLAFVVDRPPEIRPLPS